MKQAFKVILVQVCAVAMASLIAVIFKDVGTALAVLVGGMAVVVPNAIFATFVFSTSGASRAQQTVSRFYRGASIKLILSGAAIAFALKSGLAVAFIFTGFIVAVMSHIFAPVSNH